MLNKDTWILGVDETSRVQRVASVLATFGDLLSNAKIYNDSIVKKIRDYLLSINSDNFFKNHIQNIWGQLNEKQRKNLEKVANNS